MSINEKNVYERVLKSTECYMNRGSIVTGKLLSLIIHMALYYLKIIL